MSTEANKTTVHRIFEEGLNQNKPGVLDELIAPNYVNHNFPAPVQGPAAFKAAAAIFTASFPDLQVTIEDSLAEGNRVTTRGYFAATHQGDFNGIPATGKQVKVAYIDVWRLEGGQAVENWVQMDLVGLMQQLGAMPAPQPA